MAAGRGLLRGLAVAAVQGGAEDAGLGLGLVDEMVDVDVDVGTGVELGLGLGDVGGGAVLVFYGITCA